MEGDDDVETDTDDHIRFVNSHDHCTSPVETRLEDLEDIVALSVTRLDSGRLRVYLKCIWGFRNP